MSAPFVTNKIAEIRQENPELTAEQAIQEFEIQYAHRSAELEWNDEVKDGQYLKGIKELGRIRIVKKPDDEIQKHREECEKKLTPLEIEAEVE